MNQNEYGYRVIKTLEDKEKFGPKQPTDQFWGLYNDRWHKVDVDGCFDNVHTYRRPLVLPSSDYVLVGLEEVPENKQCEHTHDGIIWNTTYNLNGVAAELLLKYSPSILAIRRKKSPVQPVAGWVPISTLPKESDYPVWVTDGNKVDEANFAYDTGKPHTLSQTTEWDTQYITHWQRKEKQPKPPVKVVSEEEKAFETWLANLKEPASLNKAFKAGIDRAKKGGK